RGGWAAARLLPARLDRTAATARDDRHGMLTPFHWRAPCRNWRRLTWLVRGMKEPDGRRVGRRGRRVAAHGACSLSVPRYAGWSRYVGCSRSARFLPSAPLKRPGVD